MGKLIFRVGPGSDLPIRDQTFQSQPEVRPGIWTVLTKSAASIRWSVHTYLASYRRTKHKSSNIGSVNILWN